MNNLSTMMETIESLVRQEMQNGRASIHIKGMSLTRGARGLVRLQANVSLYLVEEPEDGLIDARAIPVKSRY